MIKLPGQIDSIRDLKDRSAKISFVTRELNDVEFVELRKWRGLDGKMAFDVSDVQQSDLDDIEDYDGKSPSKRLRNVIFVFWKENKIEEDFELFYRRKMESIIQSIKNKL